MTRQIIKVQNSTGSQQTYALFNKDPQVHGQVQGQVWSNFFSTARVPDHAMAAFSVSNQYFGFTGSSEGRPQMGVGVNVSAERPVKLGSTNPDGTHIPGSSVQLVVEDGAPQIGNNSSPDNAFSGAFAIGTQNDFSTSEASNNNYIVGLGGSREGQGFDGPLASFVPAPGVEYQIQPSSTWYLTFGDYRQGSLISTQKIGGSVATIDFSKLPGDVTIVHDNRGRLVLQRN
ncbi:hypothetical protein ACHAQI_009207 [Fusarium lateritium]